ncbi:potassium channel family protein [Streptomyces sp. TP-A0874]|uniref:potassium channel family protein n=1 Tax=Streptomyces sp. TP-A0874 TaxID=549819 RepID=UPI000852C710|nr:potassium channel family protein [Streptomyces sp. TP-A0874]
MPPLSPLFLLRKLLGGERWQRLHVKASVWAVLGLVLVLLLGSWIIVPYEHSAPRASITSFPLALWWSLETATTVGYGDLYPVTAPGRVIAGVVMLVGISVFSVVTASLATWFVGSAGHRARQVAQALEHAGQDGKADVSEEVRALHARFDRMERLLTQDRGSGP